MIIGLDFMIVMKQHILANDAKRKDMKGNLFNRLICLVRGHNYGEVRQGTKRIVESVLLGLVGFHKVNYRRCTRCGKTKEEVI